MRTTVREERGMTLVELIAVTLLIAILSTTLYRAMSGIIRSKESVESSREATRTAQSVLSRLTRELSNAVNTPLQSKKQGGGGAVFSGGQKERSEKIRFVTAGGGQFVFDGVGNAGSVEIAYRLEKRKEREDGEPEESFVLVREERPARPSGQSPDFKKGSLTVFPVASGIRSLNFRYFERGRWQERWKSAKLPSAVEITLEVFEGNGETTTFRTAVTTHSK